MILFSYGAHETLKKWYGHPAFGRLHLPGNTTRPEVTAHLGVEWACDNAAFSNFNEPLYRKMLAKIDGLPGCRFVTVPDVVGDARATLALFEEWRSTLVMYGHPLGLVGQDGLEELAVPWDEFDCFFLGGSTEWKLSDHAYRLSHEARRRGKWVHMGRVNSFKRMKVAAAFGAHSVDGSGFSSFRERDLPRGLEWARRAGEGADFHGVGR